MSNLDVFSEAAIATYEHKKKKPTSSINELNALLNWLQKKGRIKDDVKGGTQITAPLELGENQSIQNIFGPETFNTNASNIMAQLNMGWSEKVMVVQVTNREMAINRSDEEIFDLAERRVDNAITTAENRMAVELYGDGTFYESLFGLPSFITTTGGGAYAGVDPAVWPRWRNKKLTLAAGYTAADLEDVIVKGIIETKDGVSQPDLCVLSTKHFTMLERTARARVRINNTAYMKEASANAGITNISVGGVEALWDSNSVFGMETDLSYLICSKHIHLNEHPEGKWKFDKGMRPINSMQKVMVAPWMGAMYCTQRKNMAVIAL
jgi:hypothetical protein